MLTDYKQHIRIAAACNLLPNSRMNMGRFRITLGIASNRFIRFKKTT